MEVVIPSPSLDFGFNSTRSSPQLTLSAPTSPPHLSRFYKEFDGENGGDFAFDVSQDCETASLSAEDLFDGGVIKTSKPPPPRLPQATEAAAPQHRDRGRDRGVVPKRRAVRSLSPTRDPQYLSKGMTKKWRFKDFCLFRSASEGRSVGKDPLKKYTAACSSKRRGPVSAHELHYTVNRAVSEDLMKKTFLPYKQGILGRLAFNPSVHALSNGFGFSRK